MAQFVIEHEEEFEKSDDVWALRKQLNLDGSARTLTSSDLFFVFLRIRLILRDIHMNRGTSDL